MTAPSHINGIEVVKVEPCPSTLGNGSVYRKANRIRLADGQTWHGCTHEGCDFVTEKSGTSVAVWHWAREHGGKKPVHGSRKSKRAPILEQDRDSVQSIPAELMGMSLSDILDQLGQEQEWAGIVEDQRMTIDSLKQELSYTRRELDKLRNRISQ